MHIRKVLQSTFLALTLSSLSAVAAEVELKIHHFLPPPSTAHSQFIQPWADKVMKESNGRIDIKIYPAMQLGGKPPQLFDQVRDGVADIVWTVPGYTRGRFPLTEVFELPFVAGTAEATSQASWEFYQKYMQDEYKDVHPILIHTHAPGEFHMRDKPIKTLADLQNAKVRAPTRTINEALNILGATPVGMPVPAVPQALSKGVVDGAMLPYEVTLPLKVHELVKYHTEFGGDQGIYTTVFLFGMNKAKYYSLPADLKQVIDNNSGLALAKQIGAIWDQADNPGREAAKKAGNQFKTIEGEELERWKQASQPVIDNWIKAMDEQGLNGQQMYEDAKALVTKYSQ
ncbi:TRAP transporter substrate-binding protein [Sedimenticola selenatireducens]|uniref:C4-dicarboxylate ABC transporter n=1 Tax=Sedimenticola selenatireducens TaxID=191960 RepID=A0A2N6CS98_9GAMM|nr:TRAP transporter substrate-binding protein [Sedimenticola selenatireducens]PLX59952.1 MAG: C4-dicarboxylate ABC transporter [Sedimenticola selenatireducens]